MTIFVWNCTCWKSTTANAIRFFSLLFSSHLVDDCSLLYHNYCWALQRQWQNSFLECMAKHVPLLVSLAIHMRAKIAGLCDQQNGNEVSSTECEMLYVGVRCVYLWLLSAIAQKTRTVINSPGRCHIIRSTKSIPVMRLRQMCTKQIQSHNSFTIVGFNMQQGFLCTEGTWP